MKLSIVTTLYHSEQFIHEFYARISASIQNIGSEEDSEIIFVNDGSPDTSLERAKLLLERDHRVKIVDLSRNYGHHKAMMAGLSYATSDFVFLIDCDLEECPEWLPQFYAEIKSKKDIDCVYGIQNKRKGGAFEDWSGRAYYRIFNYFSKHKIPSNAVVARLMTQRFVKSLCLYKESTPVFFGLSELVGYNKIGLLVDKKSKGETTYSLRKKISLFFDAITSFSVAPLMYVFYTGLTISLGTVCASTYVLFRKLVFNLHIGWASVILSIWLFGGLTLLSIGLVGVYIARIFEEVKLRPNVIIKATYNIT